ncbi:MAG: S46 family peptidase [Phycisphaerae bacterium]
MPGYDSLSAVLHRNSATLVFISLLASPGAAARADEGMWLFNRPPTAILKQRYHFEPTPEWLEHVQKSAIRFNDGGSGSFVSVDGLVMTNHHVASDAIAKLSKPGTDLLEAGFIAHTRDEELKCPDIELNVLWSIEDVTAEVVGAATPLMSPAEAFLARRKKMTEIEQRSEDQTKLDSQIVTLYQGARYHLYRYKRFTDVRLVFAPEQQIAFLGGDHDNFEYPRYNLDCAFLRVYEDDKPYHPEHYLRWSASGTAAGDLVFVAGHPGATRRLFTVDHLKFQRDAQVPMTLSAMWRGEIKLQTFSARSDENERISKEDVAGVANGRKALTGQLAQLQDPEFMRRRQQQEDELIRRIRENPEAPREWLEAWPAIAAAKRVHRELLPRQQALQFRSRLFDIAQDIVRVVEERTKPNVERLREFSDAALDTLFLELYSPAPIYAEHERMAMENALSRMAELLGGDDPLVVKALAGKSPRARALELVGKTKLADPAYRKQLVEGGKQAVSASDDAMIQFASLLDPDTRAIRKRMEDEVQAIERDSYAKIAAAKFSVEGESAPPDATFTLRLAFGQVKGFEDEGRTIPPFTNFGGLYELVKSRHGKPPFDLPQRWIDRQGKLDPATPFNFICTGDIIGGNSGSPVVDRKGEVVGLIFDGNLYSLGWDAMFNDEKGRAVAVDCRAIPAALRVVYDLGALADELTGAAKR